MSPGTNHRVRGGPREVLRRHQARLQGVHEEVRGRAAEAMSRGAHRELRHGGGHQV